GLPAFFILRRSSRDTTAPRSEPLDRIKGFQMKSKLLAILIVATAATTGAMAADGRAIATENGCMACHAPGRPMIGPSFERISARYKGRTDAPTLLFQSIKGGSRGKWCVMTMKPDTKLSDDDARVVVDWLLAN
ncbi:MAG: c-type cytochrome, partial [Vitreoscilla sp.]